MSEAKQRLRVNPRINTREKAAKILLGLLKSNLQSAEMAILNTDQR
jgi:hypothetical protein